MLYDEVVKRFIFLFIFVFLGLFAFTPITLAQNEKVFNKDIVTLEKGEIINKDYFAAGGITEIHGIVLGDAYIAGGQVMMDGEVKGDLIIGGGTVYVMGKVDGDLRAAGGQMVISGDINGNVTAVGGSIEISDGAILGGSLTAAGGNININAPISKGANIAAGNLTVNNVVGGDLTARFGSSRFTSNSRVNGDFDYWTQENDVSIDQNAYISGTIRRHEMTNVNAPTKKQVSDVMSGVRTAFGLSSFVTTAILGILLLKFAPKKVIKASEIVKTKFLTSVLLGILAFVVAPIAVILMFVTILGIPLGVLSVVIFAIYVYVSRIFAMVAVGSLAVNKLFKKKRSEVWEFAGGLVVYYLIGVLPIVGGLLKFLIVTSGLGAGVLSLRKN